MNIEELRSYDRYRKEYRRTMRNACVPSAMERLAVGALMFGVGFGSCLIVLVMMLQAKGWL